MLVTKTTKTLNIDLWNYWHFAFIGSIVSIATKSFCGVSCCHHRLHRYLRVPTAQKKVESFYGKDLSGISIPQAFCVTFIPFAIAVNWIVERIPGLNKVDFDAKKLQKRFGILGDPIFLGVIIGMLLGLLAHYSVAKMLQLGIILSAVMVLIPRITSLFIEGLSPISKRSQELISKRFKGRSFNIGMTPALVIGHPTTLVVSLLLVPTILFLSVIIPGNEFLPLASLSGLIYIFPLVLPYTKGNVLRTFLVGLVSDLRGSLSYCLSLNLYVCRSHRSGFPIPAGTASVASIDFAASPLAWLTYVLTTNLNIVGPIVLAACALALMLYNRKKIVADGDNEKKADAETTDAHQAV